MVVGIMELNLAIVDNGSLKDSPAAARPTAQPQPSA
jgi:hypothetical protein